MEIVSTLTIFVLAVFVGNEIITKVPPTLHTPLMSGSNAISGITLVGAVLSAGAEHGTLATVLAISAVAMATSSRRPIRLPPALPRLDAPLPREALLLLDAAEEELPPEDTLPPPDEELLLPTVT